MKKYTQPMLFKDVWNLSNKKSQLSGIPLGSYITSSMSNNCFPHVLPKGMNQYPHFKFYIGNIFLLTPDEHTLYDNGTKELRDKYAKEHNCSWDGLYELYDDLKLVYETLFPAKVGTMIMKYDDDEVEEKIKELNRRIKNR